MQRDESAPPVFRDFWMRDMAHACGENGYLLRHAPGTEGSVRLFFPGCQLGAASPKLVEGAYAYLRSIEPNTGLSLGCCGAPALWAGCDADFKENIDRLRHIWEGFGRPVFILACPTCEKTFARYLPEIKTVSLYVLMNELHPEQTRASERIDAPLSSEEPRAYAVFDPCAGRVNPTSGEAVRGLLRSDGLVWEDLSDSSVMNGCCGFGGQIFPANAKLASEIVSRRTSASALPYVTYCVNCRDIFRKNGKSCRHILEICFPDSGEDPLRSPTFSERRRNRERLRRDFLKSVWGEDVTEMDAFPFSLSFGEEIRQKMDEYLILEDEIAEVIEACERTGEKLLLPESECFSGHKKIGRMTYWVAYKPCEGSFLVENVYSHRMSLDGES
jgi:hypothetical protein